MESRKRVQAPPKRTSPSRMAALTTGSEQLTTLAESKRRRKASHNCSLLNLKREVLTDWYTLARSLAPCERANSTRAGILS